MKFPNLVPVAYAESLYVYPLTMKVNITLPQYIAPPPNSDWGQWKLTDDQLKIILTEAGFPQDQDRRIIAIVRAESGGRPYAFNGNPATGDESYGLFQINMRGYLGDDRMQTFNLKSKNDLYDSLTNAKIAYAMSNQGTDWYPWGGFRNGSYLSYL